MRGPPTCNCSVLTHNGTLVTGYSMYFFFFPNQTVEARCSDTLWHDINNKPACKGQFEHHTGGWIRFASKSPAQFKRTSFYHRSADIRGPRRIILSTWWSPDFPCSTINRSEFALIQWTTLTWTGTCLTMHHTDFSSYGMDWTLVQTFTSPSGWNPFSAIITFTSSIMVYSFWLWL